MFVDIYLMNERVLNGVPPDLLSFDYDLLTNPEGSNCKNFFSKEGIETFSSLFTPKGAEKNINGLKK